MAIPPRLQIELDELIKVMPLDIVEEPDVVNVILKSFSLGSNFSLFQSDILIRVPKTYPDAGPDMFWTQPEVTFKDGRVPQAAEHMEDYCGRRWRRFSWHRSKWTPNIDNMHGYIQFIRKRLEHTN
jgi:hypothetical protein